MGSWWCCLKRTLTWCWMVMWTRTMWCVRVHVYVGICMCEREHARERGCRDMWCVPMCRCVSVHVPLCVCILRLCACVTPDTCMHARFTNSFVLSVCVGLWLYIRQGDTSKPVNETEHERNGIPSRSRDVCVTDNDLPVLSKGGSGEG